MNHVSKTSLGVTIENCSMGKGDETANESCVTTSTIVSPNLGYNYVRHHQLDMAMVGEVGKVVGEE